MRSAPDNSGVEPSAQETEVASAHRHELLAEVELVRYGGHGGGLVGGPAYGGPRGSFCGYPYYYGYWGYYQPWPYPCAWPPYYGASVYYWDYHYYPAAHSYDVMRLGLPEGALNAGGRVSGFVYFHNALAHTSHLRLTWTAHTLDGRTVTSLTIPLVVKE